MSEHQPLLEPAIANTEIESTQTAVIFDFEPNDPENPKNWPKGFKWTIVLLLACMSFTVTFTCTSVIPIASLIIEDLNHGEPSSYGSALLVTIWELGEAAGPFLIAPLSEVFGRYPILNGANVIFIAATIFAALSRSPQLFVGSRALTGFAVAVNVLNPAIIGDIFPSDELGSAISLVSLAPLIGGAVGPSISGIVSEKVGWRFVILISAALATLCEVLIFTCFRETYKMKILRQRTSKMRSEAEEETQFEERSEGLDLALHRAWESMSQPITILSSSGILLAMSLFGSVGFSFFYVLSVSLPDILRDIYGLSSAEIGWSFLALSLGTFIAILICKTTLDKIYIKLRGPAESVGQPEYRLPLAAAAAVVLPFAVASYGWITQNRLPVWSVLAVAGLVDGTVLLIIIPLSAYVVDACGTYSASAMTGVIVARCLMGTFLPLATDPLVSSFGYGLGMTYFGLLALSLAPIPIIVMRYGRKWRQRSKFTQGS